MYGEKPRETKGAVRMGQPEQPVSYEFLRGGRRPRGPLIRRSARNRARRLFRRNVPPILRLVKLTVRVSHVEAYVFRRKGSRVEILCLQRAKSRIALPGAWQPVTGKIERGERALVAAAREVREETGLTPRRWWGLETLSIWFESSTEQLAALPLYAAEVAPNARVVLSREHVAYRWLAPAAAARRFVWETQRRGLLALEREVLRGRFPAHLERTAMLAELTAAPARSQAARRAAPAPRRGVRSRAPKPRTRRRA